MARQYTNASVDLFAPIHVNIGANAKECIEDASAKLAQAQTQYVVGIVSMDGG